MKPTALAFALALATSPALAQAGGNLAPGGIVDGDKAKLNAAGGTAPDGKPLPDNAASVGHKTATSGENMSKRVGPGDAAKGAK